MHHRTGRVLSAAALATAAATVVGVTAASAAPVAPAPAAGRTARASTHMSPAYGGYPLHVSTLTTKVIMPLQLSVSKRYGVLVGDSGASKLLQVVRGGNVKTIVNGPQPGEIAGVDVNRYGDIAYTSTDYKTGKAGLTIRSHGKSKFVDLSAFEKKYNPDKKNHYGTTSTNPCVINFLKSMPDGPPPSYTGTVDSHPYSVAAVKGGWVVGDAAGNDLLFVDGKGRHIKVLLVLPPQPHKITAADAKALHAPDCVIGITYKFEPVPTDVELGPDGALYISTLPGGPEDPGFSARGSVYRFTLRSHHLRRLATGFNGATNVAVTPRGRVLVAELFAGRVSTIEHGKPVPVINLPGVASLEFFHHALYAGETAPMDDQGNPTGTGKVVKVSVRW
jgi:hypothetical protein